MRKQVYEQLLGVVKELNGSLDFDSIKRSIIEQAKVIFDAEASSLIFLDKEKNELYFEVATGDAGNLAKEIRFPSTHGIAGWIIQKKRPLLVQDAQNDKRFFQGVDKKTNFITRTIIGTPVFINGEAIGLIEVLNKRKGFFNRQDLKQLTIFADLAALTLKNAMWYKESLEKERISGDLRVAGDIQRRLLPKSDIDIPGYAYSALYKSSKDVGGDYYDVLPINENHYVLAVADVSGKGAPASLVMSMVRAYIHSAFKFNGDLLSCAKIVNNAVHADTETRRFVTMVIGILDLETNTFEFVNGGHHYPTVVKPDGTFKQYESNDIIFGIFPDYVFTKYSFSLEKDDVLVLYTDGIVECMDDKDDLYGPKRLVDDFNALKNGSLEQRGNNIMDRALAFANGEQADDMTLLMVKRTK